MAPDARAGRKVLLLLVRGATAGSFNALDPRDFSDRDRNDVPFTEVEVTDRETVHKIEALLALLPSVPRGRNSWSMVSPVQPTCRPHTTLIFGDNQSSCYNYQSARDLSQFEQKELPPTSFCSVVDLATDIARALP
eukprot:gnl/Spiro4/4729_TR2364_c0_g1_i1.p3 gnl/Spiro4/4729_TR2364_c0_g1~~gnl/Spiro4/4729_TR2364_c0_g1_i1.p3  ORF type:complete len:136 (+),score=26.52 gnl/Spiro4/4729_TR2364_c0_g1_i1:64-471(+)